MNTSFKMISLCVGFIVLFGCVHVNYVGKSFEPSDKIDVYFAKEEIKQDYLVIGHAISAGQLFVSVDKMKRELIAEAKENGADAVLITEIARDLEEDGGGFDAEKQIKASFLKYN